MDYRLAFDMGSTSIGWCLLEINKDKEPIKVIDIGTRIFSDGRNAKDQTPLSVIRRNARSMRRRLDRKKSRLTRLRSYLQEKGFFSEDMDACRGLVNLDPFEWRMKSLDEKIPLTHLGRILMHICKRRGFLSNRDLINEDETSGKLKEGIDNLTSAMSGYRTLGEYLWTRIKDKNSIRYRISLHEDEKYARDAGSKKRYVKKWDFYPQRSMLEGEVKEILKNQSKFHPALDAGVCEAIQDIIFFQRPLKAVSVGNCTFKKDHKRARKAYPIVQQYRILQEVNNLKLLDNKDGRILSDDEKKLIADTLYGQKTLTFSTIRKLLHLPKTIKFNLETESKKSIEGDSTSSFFAQESVFGSAWFSLPVEEQNRMIDSLFTDFSETEDKTNVFNKWKALSNKDQKLLKWLEQTHGLSTDQAKCCVNASLVKGYASLSLEAIKTLVVLMKNGLTYYEACQKAEYYQGDDPYCDVLPYYGECLPNAVIGGTYDEEDRDNPERYFGKINNPSVHIALNQLRHLTNAIIKKYGRPEQIIIELARELKQNTEDIIKEQTKNKKENERIDKELAKINKYSGYENRLKYKLWELSNKTCPFCGQSIGVAKLFSDQCEVEHILPFSATFNNSIANKVISCRECNRKKGQLHTLRSFWRFVSME